MTEEAKFWTDLGMVFNTKEICGGGWTGDGLLTVKGGKIAKFELLADSGPSPEQTKAAKGMKDKPVPPIPASLKTLFDKPVNVGVCVSPEQTWQKLR